MTIAKTYDPKVNRKHLKTEAAEYVAAAIEKARNGLATWEGSGNPTGRVQFYAPTLYDAMVKYAALAAQGWVLDIDDHSCLVKAQGTTHHYGFIAIAPESVFMEEFVPKIMVRAEYDYNKLIADHNKLAEKLRNEDTAVEDEEARLFAEFKASMRKQAEDNVKTQNSPHRSYEEQFMSGATATWEHA